MHIIDQEARDLALNTQESFIVQAPAGSGKTELLTQRFLALLATVSTPEEIIALTFTKKAANEMRNRILSALELAATQAPPVEPHALKTWGLAKQALTQDAKLNWSLLENPNRLRVQTIDSLCANFSTQLPILSRLGSNTEVVDDAEVLYTQAANEILSSLDAKHAWTPALEALMLHLDNNFYAVRELLIDMLKNRDQWLPIVLQSRHEQLRSILEKNLKTVISDLIINLKRSLPLEFKDCLFEFSNFSRSNLNLETWTTFPDTKLEDWLYLAKMLLTQDGSWRKTVMKPQGFPAESTDKAEKLHYKMYKTRFIEFLNMLREEEFEDFRNHLAACYKTPDTAYSDQQWKILSALLDLLPITAAQLSIEFKKADQIDFIEQTQAALNALGEVGNPTDLTLLLDCKIHHLLIDEFQDTSVTQYRLIETLISGWEINDGRTLFLVGDPMQSIYGFRAAEVGLFLQTQCFGIGNIQPKTLYLSVNFRSTDKIVHWINNCFETIFPSQIDYTTGAVNFSPAFSIKPDKDDSGIFAYQHSINSNTEAETIVDLINSDHSSTSIAILVRSRGHLAEIIPVLQASNIPYQAVEIDQLAELPYINDLLALTAALQNYGDRLAWLSILRAPWCGLSLVDLEILSSHPASSTIWDNLSNPLLTQTLSKFGQNKVATFKNILSNVFFERGKQMLSSWIYSAWLQLNPATLKKATDLDNVAVFFELLFKIEKEPHFSIDLLEKKLKKLYAKTPNETARLQIMTIHKSKGLEFDFVILPSLEKTPRPQESKLLIWLDRRNEQGQHDLLLAPIKAKSAKEDSIYEYLRDQSSEKQKLESKRLLYVAVTRAKSKLALLSTSKIEDTEEFKPVAQSFLGMLWPSCQQLFINPSAQKILISSTPKKLYRVNLLEPVADQDFVLHSANRPILHDTQAQNFGILIHRLLEKLSHTPLKNWPQVLANAAYWFTQIKTLRLPETTWSQLQACLATCLHSPRAQWILIQKLADSEYPFSAVLEGQVQHFIIDRTFVDNGVRWIIDYKTSPCEDPRKLDNFLAFQKQAYTTQLNNYAKIFAVQKYPIKFGLYFPLIDAWIEWEYSTT